MSLQFLTTNAHLESVTPAPFRFYLNGQKLSRNLCLRNEFYQIIKDNENLFQFLTFRFNYFNFNDFALQNFFNFQIKSDAVHFLS